MSVGVIIAIIICVVVLITVFAVVIVCCCCKTGGISQSKGIKMNRQSGPQQGCSNQRPAPSGYYIFILIIPLHALKITLQYVFFPDIPQKNRFLPFPFSVFISIL